MLKRSDRLLVVHPTLKQEHAAGSGSLQPRPGYLHEPEHDFRIVVQEQRGDALKCRAVVLWPLECGLHSLRYSYGHVIECARAGDQYIIPLLTVYLAAQRPRVAVHKIKVLSRM